MRIAFVINDLEREKPAYTTTALAVEASRRGHDVCYVPLAGFSLGTDDRLAAHVLRPPRGVDDDARAFIEGLRAARPERVPLDEMDVMMLRNDPADDYPQRPWARLSAVNFARFAVEAGVLVLNDPDGLMRNINKLSLEHFPTEVRPSSLISRDIDEIRDFVESHAGTSVLKPLAGSGGHNVFFVGKEDRPNLKQMIEAILSEGFVLAQEAVPEAADGDLRLFLMNGNILEAEGKPALMRRRPADGESRSNMRQGGKAEKSTLGPEVRRIAELVRPRIVADGLFLVGLDIAGAKLLEVNVFSPGGCRSISSLQGVDFVPVIIDSIECKVKYRRTAGSWSNAFLNTV